MPPDVQDCHQIGAANCLVSLTSLFLDVISGKEKASCTWSFMGLQMLRSMPMQQAYAAVVYLRTTYDSGPPTMALVSKYKGAPLKQLSIPRLELCAASLLSKLLTSVRMALQINLSNTHAWSDFTIVLYWLDGNSRMFKTFVGNRVASIL